MISREQKRANDRARLARLRQQNPPKVSPWRKGPVLNTLRAHAIFAANRSKP